MEDNCSLRYKILSPDHQYVSFGHCITPRSSGGIKTQSSNEIPVSSPFNYMRRVDIQGHDRDDSHPSLYWKQEHNSKSQRLITFARNSPEHSVQTKPEFEIENMKLAEEVKLLKSSNLEYRRENEELMRQINSLRSNIRENKNYIDELENALAQLSAKSSVSSPRHFRNNYINHSDRINHQSLDTNHPRNYSYIKNKKLGFTIEKFETGINPHTSQIVRKKLYSFKMDLADVRNYVENMKDTYAEMYMTNSKELLLLDSHIKQLKQENKRLQDSNSQLNKSIDLLSGKIDDLKNNSSFFSCLDSSKLYEKLAQEFNCYISTHIFNHRFKENLFLPSDVNNRLETNKQDANQQADKIQEIELREQRLLKEHLKTIDKLQVVCQDSKRTEKKLEYLLSSKGNDTKDFEEDYHSDAIKQLDQKLDLFHVEKY